MTMQDEAPKPAGGTPVERPVRPGLVALVRKLEIDHGPGGWPPVEMAALSALADEVERLTCQVVALEYSEGRAVAAERERWQELVAEMRHMADHVEMPDGDYCSVSMSMWAEDWLMKLKT